MGSGLSSYIPLGDNAQLSDQILADLFWNLTENMF